MITTINKCKKCGIENVTVQRVIITDNSYNLLPTCGHMHVTRIDKHVCGNICLSTEYFNADFMKVKDEDLWELVGKHGKIYCESCDVFVDEYDKCPVCGKVFDQDVIKIVRPE